jgi:Tol biopolymer transport system component
MAEQMLKGEQPHEYDNTSPAWSPDGSQIAFATNRTGRWEIWVMNADGSNQHPMFSDAVNAQIQLSPQSPDERILSWR